MRKISFVLIAMMSASCLFAVDGVVLINQSTVMAAGGFPYIITQPGSYRLSGNLTVPDINTTAISIRSSKVTVDLNGFSIIGPVLCSYNGFTGAVSCPAYGTGRGVDDSQVCPNCFFTGNTVINGVIQGMGDTGINLHGGIVKDVTVQQNGTFGIYVINGIVTNSQAYLNGADGITIANGAVSGSTANNNVGGGIICADSTAIGNTALGNFHNLTATGAGCTAANNHAP